MLNTSSANVHSGKLPLWTFVIFGITLLIAIGSTWWVTKNRFDKSEITDKVYMQIDSSFDKAINILDQYNREQVWKMDDRMNKIVFREKFVLWKPKMDSVLLIALRIKNLFEPYRNDLLNLENGNNKKDKVFSNYNISLNRIADTLSIYKLQLASLLPKDRKSYLKDLSLEKYLSLPVSNKPFSLLSKSGQLSLLNKIKFDALAATNILINFINDQNTFYDESYDLFDVLIGQNTTCLLPGQTLEVSAGLGAYASYAKPEIIINGKKMPLNYYGGATYKKVVTNKGNGSIPVSISFKDPLTGQNVTKEIMITYAIFQPPKN